MQLGAAIPVIEPRGLTLRCRRAVDLSLGLDIRIYIFGEYKQEFVIQIPDHVWS